MGAHYRSLQIRSEHRDKLLSVLNNLARTQKAKLLIGPEINEWTGIYLDDTTSADGFALALARQTGSTILDLLVHDSDIFAYSLYSEGQLVDEYSSCPDYFEEVEAEEHERFKGKPETFSKLLSSSEKVKELGSLLKARDKDAFTFEENRLEQFAKLFGIKNTLTSYDYLTDGEWEGIKGRRQFIHIPDRTAEKNAARAAATALRAEMRRLKKEGILCFESLPPGRNAIGQGEAVFDPLRGGMLFKWDHFNVVPAEPKLFRVGPPWASGPEPVEIPAASSMPGSLVFSRTGKWFAYSDGPLRLWNWPERKLIEEAKPCPTPVQFSNDEKWLLCRSSGGFTLFSLESKKVTLRITAPPHFLAWHPSGRYVIIRPRQDQLGLINLEEGKLIKILYSGTVSDRSSLASIFSGTLKEAGISDKRLNEWKRGFIVGSDHLFSIKFSSDGRLLFCASSNGVRVLEWDKVLEVDNVTPPPLLAFSLVPLDQLQEHDNRNFVYDVAYDEVKHRLLFGGIEGVIRFLNLEDGKTGILFEPPGKNYICRIQLSPDRELICCYCTPCVEDRREKPHRIHVWNYRLLREATGLD